MAVLRYSPVGDVALAPFLSVTFNQSMVPLTSLEDLAALDVPVKLTPQPEGTWRKLPAVREPWIVVASSELADSA